MTYDRPIIISVGKSRKDINWQRQMLTVSELYDRLKVPARGTETLAEYMGMKKAQQDTLKDVGGYVAGTLSGGRRKANAVTGRDIVTLDFDNIPDWQTDTVIEKLDSLNCGYCVYSTRKHAGNAPRLRVLLPTDRTMTPDEYEPVARRLAAYIDISMADPTTFEVSRLMYWPSCCSDSDFVYRTSDAPFVSVDSLLATYTDWRNISEWPQVPGSFSYQKLAVKQGDPESKTGIVGAFCKTYDIYRALEELIPGVYEPCENEKDRYTYAGGSTTGGAIIYDNGKFLYSHHATDPCSGKLVNSFDLVRLHKYGDEDDGCTADTPVNKLPSYKEMCQFASSIDEVGLLVATERYNSAKADFMGVINPAASNNLDTDLDPEKDAWRASLARDPHTSKSKGTINNIRIILENDPLLKGRFALNKFAGRGEVLDKLPWDIQEGEHRRRMWSDTDNNGLYWFMESFYEITGRGNIDAALDIHASTHAFNEVQDYINGLTWDGVKRLDTLFIDYLGAEDNEYNRVVCRKAFTAAIARAMEPGCKFDNMLILCGPQGIGKSTILDKMSLGFFNDSIRTFEGKEASELLQGVWLVEIAELDAFKRSDVTCIKQFLSLRADRYRAAYGRNVKELPRCCVFFGTCNQTDFLQDTTGNRRFWPVDVGIIPHEKTVFNDLTSDIISQVWAEAKVRWQMGEPLYLSAEEDAMARERQEEHREASAQEGLILEFLEQQVPSDWASWDIDKRRTFWNGVTQKGDYTLVPRDKICALEVWCELYGKPVSDMKKSDAREINSVLERQPDWFPTHARFGVSYGTKQRGFKRRQ